MNHETGMRESRGEQLIELGLSRIRVHARSSVETITGSSGELHVVPMASYIWRPQCKHSGQVQVVAGRATLFTEDGKSATGKDVG
jgi:hypothetical protein